MTLSLTMRYYKFMIPVILLVICIQNSLCKKLDGELSSEKVSSKLQPIATRERDLRGLRDVWEQVKSNAISSWNFLKRLAEDTRHRISQLADSARDYAIKIEKSFEEHLQDLQNRLKDIITELLGTGKLVQECLKTEGKNIQEALKDIIQSMSRCVANQIKQLTQIKGKHAQLNINDTLFMTELDNKLDACEADKSNYEECLYTVRGLVYDDMKEMDEHIQKTNLESRGLTDDIRDTLTSCSLQNLADASSFITSEMMQVVKCVLDSKGVNESILT